jgi:hypothetical protein
MPTQKEPSRKINPYLFDAAVKRSIGYYSWETGSDETTSFSFPSFNINFTSASFMEYLRLKGRFESRRNTLDASIV